MRKIFISYSHQDEEWKDRLVKQLKVVQLEGLCDVWEDRQIVVGDDWKPEIEKALNDADIAILMVSVDFLGSNFIRTEEVPRILERRETQGVWVIPVFVKPCAWTKVKWLNKIQGEPRDGKTLEERDRNGEAERILADLAEKIADRIQAVAKKRVSPPPVRHDPHPGAAHPGNPFIKTTPIQDPARFIGRETIMRRLNAKLQGGSVALSGAPRIGKSSLMLQLVRYWDDKAKIIGPLDCMGLENRDDFYNQIAEALDLDNSNWPAIRRELSHNHILLLVDELDVGPAKGLTYTDIGNFRAVCQGGSNFRMLTVSQTPPDKVFPYPGIGSRAFDFLIPETLGPLTRDEAVRLLSHPWAPEAPLFDVGAIEQLLKLAGDHPYLLQRAAYHRFEVLSDPGYHWESAFLRDKEQLL